MNFKTKTLLFIFITTIFFISQGSIAFAGFGVSPSSLANKNLVPGSFYTQDIYLVQSTPDADLKATVIVDAGKINNWIKIENGNSFTIPKGKQQFLMKVSVNVPSNAELGKYKGSITINTSPAGPQKSGVSVVLGAEVSIDLDVTSIKVSDFAIQNFQIPDVAKGSPIKFLVKVKNDGNVDNGPTRVGLTFFDQYHSKQLGSQEENITEKVKSFQTKDVLVEFPNNLDVGSYWADVKIYSEDKVVVNSKIVFDVTSGSPLASKNMKNLFTLPNFSAIPFWAYLLAVAIVIIVILIIAIIFILFKTRKHHVKKKKAVSDKDEYVKKLKIHEDK